MMKKLFMTLAILTLVMQPAFAFTLSSADQSISTCPSNTGLFVAQVGNTGSSTDIFSLGVSGAASGWASVAPAGFALGPAQSQDVYVYVTPSSNAQVGNYPLTLTVSSGASSQNLLFNYNVESCHDISLTTQVNELSVCSGNSASYVLNLRNDGQWEDTFDLEVSGEAGPWSSLSRNSVSLVPGESEQISVLVTPPRNNVGVYSLAVSATSQSAGVVVAQSLTITSRSCYDFDMVASENYVSFCDNSEAKVPVTVTNSGSENNVYSLDLDGTGWSVLDRDSISVPAGASGTFNLVLTPGFGDVGTSVFNIEAEAATGDTSDSVTINANVLTCRDTSLDIESSSIELCSGTSDTVDVMLTNAGQFQESYSLTVEGPSWVTLDRNSVILASGESSSMQLSLTPPTNVGLIYEDVTINARSQNVGNTQDSDSIRVNVPVRAACYNVDIAAEHKSVTVAYGEGALVPIVVRNTGSQSNIYEFTISGDGAQFAQINPGAIEVEGNTVEETYLYISVPLDAAKTSYTISVAAQSGDLRDSTPVFLTVSDEEPKFVGGILGSDSSLLSSIWGDLLGLYSVASNFVVNYWFVFPALLALLVVLYGLGRVRDSESWMKDLELLEQELEFSEKKEKPRPKKTQPSLLKRFSDWLMEEDEVKIITKSKPPVKSETKVKKEPGIFQRFSDWLMEEDAPRAKPKPKAKKGPGMLKRFSDWLMEDDEVVQVTRKPGKSLLEQAKEFLFEEVPVTEEKVRKPKAKKKEKGLWQKFIDWLEEEDAPKAKAKPKVKKVALKKTQPSLLKRFSDWLMEEDEPKTKSKPKPASKPKSKNKEKGLWQKFIDWLEEED
jgi:uncharacterized membrane protein